MNRLRELKDRVQDALLHPGIRRAALVVGVIDAVLFIVVTLAMIGVGASIVGLLLGVMLISVALVGNWLAIVLGATRLLRGRRAH